MSFLKSLGADLIEKRLWPIALVLLLALVAVPVFLGSGGDEPLGPVALGATGTSGAIGSEAQVALNEPGAVRLDRDGKLRDPFKQRAAPASTTGTTGTTGQPGSPQPPVETSPKSPTDPRTSTSTDPPPTSLGNPTPPKDSEPKTPSAPALSTYVTELRFGRPNAPQPRRTVARLTPLPTVAQPFFVYLGVLSDRKTAVFLLSSDVKATGEGACKPDKKICETVELRKGETETLTVTNDDDSTTRYELSVLAVRRKGAASADGTASSVKETPTAKGSEEDLGSGRYEYDDRTGLLRRVRKSSKVSGKSHLPARENASAVERSRIVGGRLAALPAEGLWAMPEFSPLL